jgi:hypothetical protein
MGPVRGAALVAPAEGETGAWTWVAAPVPAVDPAVRNPTTAAPVAATATVADTNHIAR